MCSNGRTKVAPSKILPGKFKYSEFSADIDLSPRRPLSEVVAMSPEEMAQDDLGLSNKDLKSRPFNKLKSYVWSQIGQLTLYEIFIREGYGAARATVGRLVSAK